MTSRTSNLPIRLTPCGKDYLWGGSRLNDDFSLGLSLEPFAEAWVCSTHSDGESRTDSGVFLSTVLKKHPDYLGTHALSLTEGRAELPILIKLIDAKKDLSVQVHPDDTYAKIYEHGSLGKTEMWYVLDAKPQSTLVYGFNRTMSSPELRQRIESNSITAVLNKISVQKNDVFTINPGMVHAIGAGCLIAEIQESSNITYRLYDYNRTDKNGLPRELHIDKALDVADLDSTLQPRQPMRTLRYRRGIATELLSRCKYFQVERMLLNTQTHRPLVDYRTSDNSFHALLITEGCGSITTEGYHQNVFKGDCFFIPTNSAPLKLHGRTQILDISC